MSRSGPPGRPWRTGAWIVAGAAVTLACGAAGWTLGTVLLDEPSAPAPSDRLVTAGPVRLKVSSAWQRADRAPTVPGLGTAPAFTPYAGLTTTVSVALVPADHRTLVPATLVKAAGAGLPRAGPARIAGLDAWAYRGVPIGRSVVDLYAIPTTRGVLTLACTGRSGADGASTWCLNGLERLAVDQGRPLPLDSGVAYRMHAPSELRRFDAVRVRERRALSRAKGPVSQRRAADALERSYAATAMRLEPIASPDDPSGRVVSALREASRSYAGLAGAAAQGSRERWTRARAAVDRAEDVLAARLEAASQPSK